MATASVSPVASFPDEPAAWLDYLAQVTRWTLGARCSAAELVVVGGFDAAAGEIAVDSVLKGQPPDASVAVELPRPTGAGAPSQYQVPDDSDRVLAFLAGKDD